MAAGSDTTGNGRAGDGMADGWAIHRFDVIDSTNRWLADQCRAGAPGHTVAIAAQQSAGRGRLGRQWTAPPGSALLMSVLIRPSTPIDEWHLATFAMALALTDVVASFGSLSARAAIKWPNDVLLEPVKSVPGSTGASEPRSEPRSEQSANKLAGILAEAVAPTADQPGGVVVGIGVNLRRPESIDPVVLARATWLDDHMGTVASDDHVAAQLLQAFDARLALSRSDLLDEVGPRCSTIGRAVRVELPNGVVDGVAEGLDLSGALRVRVGDELRIVHAGDIVHLR